MKRLLIAAGLLALAGAGLSGQPAPAQASAPAVLVKGPERVQGIPIPTPNVIPAWRGLYRAEGRLLEVFYTRARVPVPAGWPPPEDCAGPRLVRVPGEELSVGVTAGPPPEAPAWLYTDARGYVLLFTGEPAPEPACAFAAAFVERFNFLLPFARHETDVPFPAVLELAR